MSQCKYVCRYAANAYVNIEQSESMTGSPTDKKCDLFVSVSELCVFIGICRNTICFIPIFQLFQFISPWLFYSGECCVMRARYANKQALAKQVSRRFIVLSLDRQMFGMLVKAFADTHKTTQKLPNELIRAKGSFICTNIQTRIHRTPTTEKQCCSYSSKQ